jgi:hypothetical protein
MPGRTAKFVSTVFVSILAGTAVATLPCSAARAADDCLAAPKDQTPEGSHWYYRIEHGTKRHCWYLRTEGEKLSQATPSNASPSATPAAPKEETPAQRSISDARAELPPQAMIEQPNRSNVLMPTPLANVPAIANTASPELSRSLIASRWPETSSASPVAAPSAAPDNPVAQAPPNPAPVPPQAVAAATPAAPDASSPAKTSSIPLLLSAVSGALALAGITASVVFKLAGQRPLRQAKLRLRRDAIWEPTDDDRIVLSADPVEDVLPRRPGFARDIGRGSDGNDRVADFFEQLTGRRPS